MIQQSTIQFLKDLKKNNNKEWFDKNRNKYERAKADYEQFAVKLIDMLGKTDKTIAHLTPKQCMFRINRDVRFSKDKSPYKTNMGIYLSKGGKKSNSAGYYFHLEPGNSFVAGGLWMPPAPDLKKIRQEIDYNWDEFRKIVESKKFRTTFGGLDTSSEYILSRPPKGYEADNPAIAYLKFKSLIAVARISDKDILASELPRKAAGYFALIKPLVDFCNQAVEE